jgi:PAS domain S-box-containing protein
VVSCSHGDAEPDAGLSHSPEMPEAPRNILLGTLDQEWRIDRVSQDVVEMLGYAREEATGLSLLGFLHPADVPAVLGAIDRARTSQRTVEVTARVRAKSGAWKASTALLATVTDADPPALAFALVTPAGDRPARREAADTKRELVEAKLQRVARDLRAAGVAHATSGSPDGTLLPALSRLTARQLQILVLLLDGERVPSIADALYVSQSTVRNHLSSIFAKVGVHSQADLVHQMRTD